MKKTKYHSNSCNKSKEEKDRLWIDIDDRQNQNQNRGKFFTFLSFFNLYVMIEEKKSVDRKEVQCFWRNIHRKSAI